ncbi:uncharacterized protein DUF2512 [Mobilisporobacter senegalensis]|uniref:Uncharacterized protein DUF2512 n=1 Tax=Mobilisporobacter senegalensis TaxID=1329262 RepID=A0A3N1XL97_9FIRM|nr:DUF2512 family protein [Mobilisporobacter senegalensis]ROR27483.1 uncharacterized protein DUF2512 [Mobilisporobacter senegalensis]
MKHGISLILKYMMVVIIIGVILKLTSNITVTDILYISFPVTILAYIIGDLIILSRYDNTTATIVDIGLALLIIYLFNYILEDRMIPFYSALTASVALGVGECFFHKYVARFVFPNIKEK